MAETAGKPAGNAVIAGDRTTGNHSFLAGLPNESFGHAQDIDGALGAEIHKDPTPPAIAGGSK